MKKLSRKSHAADKHPLENPYDIALMFLGGPVLIVIIVLVWAAA